MTKDGTFLRRFGMSLRIPDRREEMPMRGLRLDIEECNHIVQQRYLAKKRKDLDARVRLILSR